MLFQHFSDCNIHNFFKMRLAIIGAGVSGLAAARWGIEFGCDVTVFEQTDKIGGTWNFNPEIGKDKHGLDIHTSMYKGLFTNLPKEVMGYPDFPFAEQERSYIPSEDVLEYLNQYADKFNLRNFIRFEYYVVRVKPLSEDKWEIIVKDLAADKCEILFFDGVLVCNGHYHTPFIPKIKGQDVFKGKQLHSHDFRDSSIFKGINQNMLL